MEKYIDLHTHSTGSDGTLTPSELAEAAKKSGLAAAALTDHDTVEGVEEFMAKTKEIGIEGIAGVEISAKFRTEMHIVGLMVDYKDREFREKLDFLKQNRQERNRKVLELINKEGIDITVEDITGQKEEGRLENTGRAHMARALVKKGYAKDMQDAFDKYLKKGGLCYVPRITYSPEESIKMIKKAGGVAVLAHPYYITKDRNELKEILLKLKGFGLDAFECLYSDYPKEYRDMCMELAQEVDMLKSGGSDFHAMNKPKIKIGYAGEGQRIPYEYLQRLKDRKAGKI